MTLLFSDIEGSTHLLSQLGEAYSQVLDLQRSLLRESWAAHEGFELGTEGDGFFVVFDNAPSGVQASIKAQRELGRAAWPDGTELRVRIGLHTGSPARHADGYVGMDVHRAARVAASAHGGQIVVTEPTAVLASAVDDGVSFLDLGRHRFKDLPRPEHVFQVTAPGLLREFQALRSLGSPSSLPLPATALVGREVELAELRALLTSTTTRLVTLTGPGGSGKTRLATELAAEVTDHFGDGVFFVDLEAVTESSGIFAGIASALAVSLEAGAPSGLLDLLRHRSALLVLDNLEQVRQADQALNQLLAAAPNLRVLGTSRQALHVKGEQEYPVPPLAVPAMASPMTEETPAEQLFVQQARLVRPSFEMTDANQAAVAEICRRLDGLPLALELAGARSKLLTPQALLNRLDHALDLKAFGTGERRHQTLRATIAWSYDLLDPQAQRLFRCLAVFPGGASLEAVDRLWNFLAEHEVEPADEVLQRLVDASLVDVIETPDGTPRIETLNTIREFATGELSESPDHVAAHVAAVQFLDKVMWEGINNESPGALSALPSRLEEEVDNYRAALTWLLSERPPNRRKRVAQACLFIWGLSGWLFWRRGGYGEEARSWCEQTMKAVGSYTTVEAAACETIQARLMLDSDIVAAEAATDRAHRKFESGHTDVRVGAEGIARIGRFLAYTRAEVAQERGEFERAEKILREWREAPSSPRDRISDLLRLALLRTEQGDFEAARALDQEAWRLALDFGDEWLAEWAGQNLACDLRMLGRIEAANEQMKQVIPRTIANGNPEDMSTVAEDYAAILADLGRVHEAALLWGAAWAERERASLPTVGMQERLTESAVTRARTALADEWETALERGKQLSVEHAFGAVLGTQRKGLEDGSSMT